LSSYFTFIKSNGYCKISVSVFSWKQGLCLFLLVTLLLAQLSHNKSSIKCFWNELLV
jgi:hypothetical protein